MSENTARDITRIRLRLIDLVKSFFIEEPDAERISRWRGVFSALANEQIGFAVDEAVKNLKELLESTSLTDIQAEFYEMFGNPFSNKPLSLSASFYVDGRDYGQALADFRGLLGKANIIKEEAVKDTEDSLPVMLDSLARLIEDDSEKSDAFQQELIEVYLHPLSANLNSVIQKREDATFYTACIAFLKGYVELERALYEPA